MKSVLAIFIVIVLFFGFSVKPANAALLNFTKNGELYWNVLGLENTVESAYNSALEVQKIANHLVSGEPIPVVLSNENGHVLLSYGKSPEKPVDITGYDSEIVEIEGDNSARTVSIAATDNGFIIQQKGIIAETQYPITIDSPRNRLSLNTDTGNRLLSVLPFDAVNQIIRTNIISSVLEAKITLVEKEEGEVAYVVQGEKQIILLNIIALQVPVNVEVSALTGSVIKIDQPLWYSALDFLLV